MLRPGDVVIADFPGADGIKRRPCVVVSSELYHSTRPDVLLAVVTSNIVVATAPSDFILFDWREAGLDLPCAVRIYLSSRLQRDVRRIGRLRRRLARSASAFEIGARSLTASNKILRFCDNLSQNLRSPHFTKPNLCHGLWHKFGLSSEKSI